MLTAQSFNVLTYIYTINESYSINDLKTISIKYSMLPSNYKQS